MRVAGAVLGGLIAGPVGAVVGAVAGSSLYKRDDGFGDFAKSAGRTTEQVLERAKKVRYYSMEFLQQCSSLRQHCTHVLTVSSNAMLQAYLCYKLYCTQI